MAYSITPYSAMGGTIKEQTLTNLISTERSPHFKWADSLRLATDFITPDNTLICVGDRPFADLITNVTPIGLTQSLSVNEGLQSTLQPEIGSRRKRAMVGSSSGGSLNISRMTTMGKSTLATIYKYAESLGIDASKSFWSEKEWVALVGLNHDYCRTPISIVVVEAAPDGRNYCAYVCEQALMQGGSKGYQAGQHIVVDNLSMIFEQQVPVWGSEETSLGGGSN